MKNNGVIMSIMSNNQRNGANQYRNIEKIISIANVIISANNNAISIAQWHQWQ
jgi:hypothetical protein